MPRLRFGLCLRLVRRNFYTILINVSVFFSSRRRHTRWQRDWSSDVCSSDLVWEEQGYDGMDGVAWYRTSFNLTEQEASFDLRLHLAMIDDADITYVNGHEVGRGMEYNRARIYDVPSSALVPGSNVLAVRVTDFQGGGGIYGSASDV